MSYDFFVLPGRGGIDPSTAMALAADTPHDGVLTPGGPMARFVDAVQASSPPEDPWLSITPLGGHDDGVHVPTTFRAPSEHLLRLTRHALDEGLAVVDLQTGLVHDPTVPGTVRATVTTDGATCVAFTSPAVLRTAVLDVLDRHSDWLIVERDDHVYAQAYRHDDGSWDVEHRDGGPDRHFAASSTDAVEVERFLWAWASQADGWRDALAFVPLAL